MATTPSHTAWGRAHAAGGVVGYTTFTSASTGVPDPKGGGPTRLANAVFQLHWRRKQVLGFERSMHADTLSHAVIYNWQSVLIRARILTTCFQSG